MSRTLFGTLAAALALLLVSPAAYAAEITLGASVQLTGKLANTGRYYRDGYRFAVDRINSQGGIKVNGKQYKLALKVLDNQSDANLSVRQYVQLVTEDNIKFLLGPYSSGFVLADSSVAEKYALPMIEGGGASDQIFSRGYQDIFGTLPVASKYFSSTVDAMQKLSPAPRTVALLYADDAFDVAVAKGTRTLIKDAGMKLAIDERYSTSASDFNSLLARIKSAGVDAVLMAGHETEILNFIRQAKSLDVSPKLYAFTVGVPSEDFRHALGADANFAFGMTPWLPSATAKDPFFGNAAAFAKAYKARFGYEPDYHAASAVADVEAFAKAIEHAGTTDPKAVRKAITQLNFQSEYGRIAFNDVGQISLPQTLVQVQHGHVRAIYGGNGFITKPDYPMPGWNQR